MSYRHVKCDRADCGPWYKAGSARGRRRLRCGGCNKIGIADCTLVETAPPAVTSPGQRSFGATPAGDDLILAIDAPAVSPHPTRVTVSDTLAPIVPLQSMAMPAPSAAQLILVSGDWHMGHERKNSQVLPMHDRAAIDVFIQTVWRLRPHTIILNGDLLDVPEMTIKHARKREHADTMQSTIYEAYSILRMLRDAAPSAVIVYNEGNHEERMTRWRDEIAPGYAGLLSGVGEDMHPIRSLLALDSLGIDYRAGWPHATWRAGRLTVAHGWIARASYGGTAGAYLQRGSTNSIIVGHSHRPEVVTTNIDDAGTMVRVTAAVAGTLAHHTRLPGGEGFRSAKWGQGFAMARISDEHDPIIDLVEVRDGFAIVHGRAITAREWAVPAWNAPGAIGVDALA